MSLTAPLRLFSHLLLVVSIWRMSSHIVPASNRFKMFLDFVNEVFDSFGAVLVGRKNVGAFKRNHRKQTAADHQGSLKFAAVNGSTTVIPKLPRTKLQAE